MWIKLLILTAAFTVSMCYYLPKEQVDYKDTLDDSMVALAENIVDESDAKVNAKIMGFLAAAAGGIFSGLRATAPTTCKDIDTVKSSVRSLKDNVDMDGHVWIHIGGLVTRPVGAIGTQRGGKTMFTSVHDFQEAWNNLAGKAICANDGNQAEDCASADTLGITSAYQCRRPDSNGICTNVKSFTPTSIQFWYEKNDNGWILRTAFPSKNPC